MSILNDIRQQKRIRAAEGYLDLIMVLSDRWPLKPETRDRIARRALNELSSLPFAEVPLGDVHLLQGQALRAMDNFQDAIEPLKMALKLDPNNIHIHLALGWCYKRTGRLDLAIQSLEEAMEVMPEEGIIHYNLACYWSLANNAAMAVQYLNQSFEIDPNYRDMVSGEEDFDPIRNDAGFQSVTSVIV
jgi:tetratricopeptide (TPR) repeat protein